MQIDPTELRPVLNRVKRAHGHLGKVIALMEDGTDCEEVITQYGAALKALERAGYALVATGMRQCLAGESGSDGYSAEDAKRMEKLFISLA